MRRMKERTVRLTTKKPMARPAWTAVVKPISMILHDCLTVRVLARAANSKARKSAIHEGELPASMQVMEPIR